MKKTDISGVVDIIRDNYTLAKPCLVDGCPDAHTVWLKIQGQSFCIDGYQDTKDEADWMCKMLAKALTTFLLENSESIPRRQIKLKH